MYLTRLLRRTVGRVAVADPVGLAWILALALGLATLTYAVANGWLAGEWTQLFGANMKGAAPRTSATLEPMGGVAPTVTAYSPRSSLLADAPYLDGKNREEAGGRPEVRAVRRYVVELAAKPGPADAPDPAATADPADRPAPYLLVAEFRHETSGPTEWVAVDVACWVRPAPAAASDPPRPLELRRIPWWETKDLALSNRIIQVTPNPVFGFFLRDLRFDTSPPALTTWIRAHWLPVVEGANPEYKTDARLRLTKPQVDAGVAGPLELAVNTDWRDLRLRPSVVALRVINGSVQWLTLAAFYGVLIVTAGRWWVFIVSEGAVPVPGPSNPGAGGDAEGGADDPVIVERALADCARRERAHYGRWGVTSAVLGVYSHALEAVSRGAAGPEIAGLIGEHAEYQLNTRSSRGYVWRFLLGAMPALGFIGTVMGIGDALMGTGSVLSDELGKQQSGVSTVALALGFAFDTTLIALVLSLVASFVTSWLTSAEERVVFDAQTRTLDAVLPLTRRDDQPAPAAEPSAPARPPVRPAPPTVPASWRLQIADRSDRYAEDAAHFRRRLFRGRILPFALAVLFAGAVVAARSFLAS